MFGTNKCLWVGALLVLIACRGLVLAQPPAGQSGAAPPAAPEKMSLEDMLTRALKDHPDIRVAEARLKESEAELSRARMQVAQKVIAFHASLVTARKQVEEAEGQVQRLRPLVEKKVVAQEQLHGAE